tara:strand:- start:38 stop:1099 length:1062 start_codon:yes stop_codon:yes gene_type:complete
MNKDQPFITIILPIRNEEKYIKGTLQSIYNQEFNKNNFEVIISDGCSNDGTIHILDSLQKIYTNLKVINNPEKLVSSGFNRALSIAKGTHIIRVDGHSKLDPKFLNNCIKLSMEKNVECVGGATKHVPVGVIGTSISIAQSTKFGVGGVAFREGVKEGQYVDTLAFGAYQRKIFIEIGGYDEELYRNQDDEFNLRLIQNGGNIWLDPSINSFYYPRKSLMTFFNQYFQYGFYKVRVIQKRRTYGSIRHFVPILFVLSLCFSFIIIKTHNFFLPSIIIVFSYVFLSIISTIKAYLDYSNNSLLSIILLPATYAIMHLAYGLGSLFGLIYFAFKWKDTDLKDINFNKRNFKGSEI